MEWSLVGREAELDHASVLVEAGTGIAILGPAGVGKSRLLHEVVDRAGKSGMAVVRTAASDSTRSIPLAPFVELLPPEPTRDRLGMLASARRVLDERRTADGIVIAVDDAHHLDAASLTFLLGAVSNGSATVAITARSGEPMEADLVDLWTNGVISRIDLDPLSRSRSRELIEATLGRVTPHLEEELWRLSRGNPLILHELIGGARDSTILRDSDGVWRVEGTISASARLADLVSSRLNALPVRVREALEVLALGAPLPLGLAESVAGEGLQELEERGLVELEGSATPVVSPAHPLYGEVLVANLVQSRRKATYRRLVEASLASGVALDRLRLAVWQSKSGYLLSQDVAIAGANEALVRHDPGLAESLARPLAKADDERAALILGRALSYQQRFDEAEAILAERAIDSSPLYGEIVSIRAQNLGFGLGLTDEARDLLGAAASRLQDPGMRSRLNNERAMVSAISGDFTEALAASRAVLTDDESNDLARVAAYVTLTIALSMTGDCDAMDDLVPGAVDLARSQEANLPFAADQIEIMQFCSLLSAGRIPQANEVAERAIERTDRGTALTATWLSASCLGLDLAGRLMLASNHASSALEMYREADPFGLEAQTRGLKALILGQLNDPACSQPIEDVVVPSQAPRIAVWVARGRAWSAVVEGDVDRGAEIAVAGGRDAAAREHFVWAALCFHDAVRLGRPELAIDELRSIDDSRGARLVTCKKRHSEALVHRNPGKLADVARGFAGIGAPLLAAEAWAQAALLFHENGDGTAAARACALSLVLEQRCEGANTPALRNRPNLVSEREMEVAADAASGLTSPQIADGRYISVRTVDNHLRSVYRKLDLGGRGDLAVVLDSALNE